MGNIPIEGVIGNFVVDGVNENGERRSDRVVFRERVVSNEHVVQEKEYL